MSTVAPPSDAHDVAVGELAVTRQTVMARFSRGPGRTLPSEASVRMSARFSFSSTKYGPSVSAGRTTHEGTPGVPATGAPVTAGVADVVGRAVGDASTLAGGAYAARKA